MSEKRMAGDYEIIRTFSIGHGEVVFGEKPNEQENRYLVADYISNDIIGEYSNAIGTDDYLEAVEEYAKRIQERVKELQHERASNTVDLTPLSEDNCVLDKYEQDLIGKIVVIKADTFKPEYRQSVHQLQLCTGGNGARKNAMGRACFCTNLYTGEESRFERYDVLGTISKDKLPDWAKEGLQKIENKRAERRKNDRGER